MRVLGARYYSPEIGRFVQPDSMLPDMYDPQQLNRYAYVRGNPLKYVDPTGHEIYGLSLSIGSSGRAILFVFGVSGSISINAINIGCNTSGQCALAVGYEASGGVVTTGARAGITPIEGTVDIYMINSDNIDDIGGEGVGTKHTLGGSMVYKGDMSYSEVTSLDDSSIKTKTISFSIGAGPEAGLSYSFEGVYNNSTILNKSQKPVYRTYIPMGNGIYAVNDANGRTVGYVREDYLTNPLSNMIGLSPNYAYAQYYGNNVVDFPSSNRTKNYVSAAERNTMNAVKKVIK